MKLLNLGCGNTFDSRWINLDINPSSGDVIKFDLRKNLPYKDDYFDAVYCSHVIEHLSDTEARKLILDVYRVLKPNGIFRVAVPDLEKIAKLYVKFLGECLNDQTREKDYDWIYLEMYDQVSRNKPGGDMYEYLTQKHIPNKKFILSRIGREGSSIINNKNRGFVKYFVYIKSKNISWYFFIFRYFIAQMLLLLVGGNYFRSSFRDGIFRNSGEIHKHMYDRFSLERLLNKYGGFKKVHLMFASQSNIKNFSIYNLDVYRGKIRKPDSIFMEAIK